MKADILMCTLGLSDCLEGSGASNATKIPREDTQRQTKRVKMGGRGEKKREILGPPPFGAPPFGAPPFLAPPFGAPPFEAPPFGAPPFGAPPFGAQPFGPRPPCGAPFFLGLAPPFGPHHDTQI